MKKLLYIHQYFTFPKGSGGTRSYDLSKAFVKNGIDVTVVTTSANIHDIDISQKGHWIYTERENIKFWILKCPYNQKMSIPRRLISFLKFLFYSSIKCVRLKADVVLATSTPLSVAIPAIIKKTFSGTPYIFEVRDVWPEGPIQLGYVKNGLLIKILRNLEKFIYKKASYIVVLSTGMETCITSRIKNINKIEVIPNISEIDRFSNFENKINLDFIDENKQIILYAGTLGPVNNIMYVAEFAAKLKKFNNNNILFLIIGDGNQKLTIQNYCQDNNIDNILFIDKIPKEALPYVYSKSFMGSSFVIDNKIKWDNSANKFFDTLAAGKPILINHRGWQADLIEKENIGYILPPYPTDEDADRFISYISNDSLLAEQGHNAKNIATKLFSLDVAVNHYLSVIFKVLNNK